MTQANANTASLEDVRKEERILQARGFQYRTITVPLTDVDLEASRIWNGRTETESRLSDEKVLDYALRMLDGEEFPYGIVFREKPSGKLTVVSGVHRGHSAVEAELPTLTWFEITDAPTDALLGRIKALGVELNTRHGLGLSRSERLTAACDQVDQGIPLTQVARNIGAEEKEIREALEEREANRALLRHNLKPEVFTTKVQKREIVRLPDQGLMRDVQALVRRNTPVGEGAHRSPVTNEFFVDLVRELIAEKSPQGRSTILVNAEARLNEKKKGKGKRAGTRPGLNPKFVWARIISAVPAISPTEIARSAETTEGAHQIIDDTRRIRKVLDDVESAVEAMYGLNRWG